MLKEPRSALSRVVSSWVKSRKPRLTIEQFCEMLYANFVFFSAEDCPEDAHKTFWSEIFDSILKADDGFQHVDRDMFTNEMTALHVELFGLAWMHHFNSENYDGLQEKHTLDEIAFTKSYMEHNGHGNVWNTMSYYNRTIADALLHPCVKAIDRGFTPLATFKQVMPFYVTNRRFTEEMRGNIEVWRKEVGSDCATRFANRISKRENWGGCPIALMLTKTFAQRLGWKADLTSIGFAGFEAILNRLYNDLKQTIEAVRIE